MAITLNNNLQLNNTAPLDARTKIASLAAKNTIVNPYVGLIVWVDDPGALYIVKSTYLDSTTLLTKVDALEELSVGAFVINTSDTEFSELVGAITSNKIIVIEDGDSKYFASVGITNNQNEYLLSYVDSEGALNQITANSSGFTHTTKSLVNYFDFTFDDSNSANTTTPADLKEAVDAGKLIRVNGYVATKAECFNNAGTTFVNIYYYDDEGKQHHIYKNATTQLGYREDIGEALSNAVTTEASSGTFSINNSDGDPVGTITLSTAASGAAVLTFTGNNKDSFVATLPNLTYDSTTQMLKMVDAGENETNLIKISNLQIKTVFDYSTYRGTAPTSPSTGTYAIGDLALVEKQDTTTQPATVSYELAVVQSVTAGTPNTIQWQEIGSINSVSLVANQVGLSSTKFEANNVKGGLEELYDKIDGVGASYWTGSIGISTATSHSSVSGLAEYNKQSEPIDVYVTTAGYLWIVSSVKIIAETSGIEIPMLAPVKSGDLYYYRSEEVVNSTISVMVKALAKQEGTDPNNNITISGDALETITKTAGDAYVTLSLPTITSNNGGILSYQWEKQGQAISGANSQTYEVGGNNQDQELVESDSGHYRCKVTNSLGGYEYTKGTILVVNASQGGDTTSDWLEDTGVVHGEIATLQGYSLSPAYQIDNGDVIYAWVGENNSDQTKKIISGWIGDTWKCGWNEIKYNGRLVYTSEEAGVNNIRVMIRTSIIDKCFIYNCTKSTWLYKGASLGNVYNNFEWCKWVKTGSAYGSGGVLTIQDAKQSDNALTQTHISPLIPLQPNHILSFKTGLTNSNGGYAKLIFYDSSENPLVVRPVGYEYSRYYAIGSTDPRILTDTDAERITSTMAYGRLFISAMSMHECYLKDETTGEYLWKGIDVID